GKTHDFCALALVERSHCGETLRIRQIGIVDPQDASAIQRHAVRNDQIQRRRLYPVPGRRDQGVAGWSGAACGKLPDISKADKQRLIPTHNAAVQGIHTTRAVDGNVCYRGIKILAWIRVVLRRQNVVGNSSVGPEGDLGPCACALDVRFTEAVAGGIQQDDGAFALSRILRRERHLQCAGRTVRESRSYCTGSGIGDCEIQACNTHRQCVDGSNGSRFAYCRITYDLERHALRSAGLPDGHRAEVYLVGAEEVADVCPGTSGLRTEVALTVHRLYREGVLFGAYFVVVGEPCQAGVADAAGAGDERCAVKAALEGDAGLRIGEGEGCGVVVGQVRRSRRDDGRRRTDGVDDPVVGRRVAQVAGDVFRLDLEVVRAAAQSCVGGGAGACGEGKRIDTADKRDGSLRVAEGECCRACRGGICRSRQNDRCRRQGHGRDRNDLRHPALVEIVIGHGESGGEWASRRGLEIHSDVAGASYRKRCRGGAGRDVVERERRVGKYDRAEV